MLAVKNFDGDLVAEKFVPRAEYHASAPLADDLFEFVTVVEKEARLGWGGRTLRFDRARERRGALARLALAFRRLLFHLVAFLVSRGH
jgi:hypothetical protein